MERREGDAAEGSPGPAPEGSSREAAEGGSSSAERLTGDEAGKLDLLTVLRVREQIKQHLMEYNTAINAVGEENIPDPDEKLIELSMEDLEKEMEEIKVSYENKNLALQRIQVADALTTRLKDNDHESKVIWDKIMHILLLNTAILISQQQSHELEEKLNEVKQSRLALKRAGECKLAQINDTKRKQKEKLENMEVGDKLKKIRRNLQQEVQMTTLIQNIFQNLIAGSGVNWAKDPDLKAIVLQLEENVMKF